MPLWVVLLAMIVWLSTTAIVMYKIHICHRDLENIAKLLRFRNQRKLPPPK